MDLLTRRAQSILTRASSIVNEHPDSPVDVAILASMAEGDSGIPELVLSRFSVGSSVLSTFLETPRKTFADVIDAPDLRPFADRVARIIERAKKEADALRHSYVGCEHLLLAVLAMEGSPVVRLLSEASVEARQMRSEIFKILGHYDLAEGELTGASPVTTK